MYQGREGQWAFYLHRVSGLALLLYLMIHTISIGSVLLGPDVYGAVHEVYKFILFRLGLIAITGAVAYHSFNGLRIVVMDFTGWGVRYQRQLWYTALVLAAGVMVVALVYNFPRLIGGA